MRRVWTPRWVLVHIAVVLMVVAFLRLGWWQLTRAAEGNVLSFGYALQWPAFAVFVIFIWIKEMRLPPRKDGPEAGPRAGVVPTEEPRDEGAERGTSQRRRPQARVGPAPVGAGARASGASAEDTDEELAAYNRYLAWLNAHPHASPREYPG